MPQMKAKPRRHSTKHRFNGKNKTPHLVFSCGDNKLQAGMRRVLRENGIFQPDNLKLVGGPGVLASLCRPHSRLAFLEDAVFMIKNHDVKIVVLLSHQKCGAYAGEGHKFACSRFTDRECDFHVSELRLARAATRAFLNAHGLQKVRIRAGVQYVDKKDRMHIHWIR